MTRYRGLISPSPREELQDPERVGVPNNRETRSQARLTIEHVHSVRELRLALPEWRSLYAESGVLNPFLDPLWVLPWIEHYANTKYLDIMLVWMGEKLVGVAPFCRLQSRMLRRLYPVCMHLIGSEGRDNLTELTEPLILPDRRRAILKEIVAEAASRPDWDWMELSLSAEQGWIETQWWPMRGRRPRFVAIHKATVASVILDLDPNIPLKRNMRRILRHRRNQLEREMATVSVERFDNPDQIPSGIEILHRLHAARSVMNDVPKHPNMLTTDRSLAFLKDAITAMAAAGHAAIYVLFINGQASGVQLVLIANGCYYLALSGMDPSKWQVSPLTLLTAAVIDDAKARGAKSVNLSTGPNTAKLAWSEKLEFHQHFLIVKRAPLSALRFGAYWQARSFNRFWYEYRHQRRQGGK